MTKIQNGRLIFSCYLPDMFIFGPIETGKSGPFQFFFFTEFLYFFDVDHCITDLALKKFLGPNQADTTGEGALHSSFLQFVLHFFLSVCQSFFLSFFHLAFLSFISLFHSLVSDSWTIVPMYIFTTLGNLRGCLSASLSRKNCSVAP